ncbi:MAG: TVP38/TMEM64 family protein [archaeon]
MTPADWKENLGPILFLTVIGSITLIPIIFPEIFAPIALEIQSHITTFGVWGPVAMVGLMILATIFSPIPNSFITLTIGATYGPVFGTFLALLGSILASALAFWLSRRFGQGFVDKYIPHTHMIHSFFKNNAFMTVFVLRLIPSVSFDMVSYGAGLTTIPWRTFLIATFLGIIPGTVSIILVGSGLTYERSFAWIGIAIYALLIIAGVILSQRMMRDAKKQ